MASQKRRTSASRVLVIKIDHHIAAENHVKFQPEPDGVHQVKGAEDHVVPDGGGHRVFRPSRGLWVK